MNSDFTLKYVGKDASAGLVVFLVALPLCLGIAMASGASLFSGVIAGIVGGILVGAVSGSALGVSGPAAGLTVIVLTSIQQIGSFEAFLVAVVLAGIIQLFLAWIGAGKIAYYFPSSVINGMLAAIGIIIIMKQIPHVFGVDKDYEGDFDFWQNDGQNTLSEIVEIFQVFNLGALLIGAGALLTLILWGKLAQKNKFFSIIPGALGAVFLGILVNEFYPSSLKISGEHLVKLPTPETLSGFKSFMTFPDFSAISNPLIWKIGLTLAIIASLETLLSVEAIDRIDPDTRITPTNRELLAQGVGNIVCGLIGGLPVTQVIVRSSANMQSGGKTKLSAVIHGFLLLLCVVSIPTLLNKIPLACLAAVLLMVGYKLAKPSLFKKMFQEGQDQFIPFIVTVLAVVFTDLLTGVLVGLAVGIGYVLYNNFKNSILIVQKGADAQLIFVRDVFFFNRAELFNAFEKIKTAKSIMIDGTKANFIDHDIFLTLEEFIKDKIGEGVLVEVKNISRQKLGFSKNSPSEITVLNV